MKEEKKEKTQTELEPEIPPEISTQSSKLSFVIFGIIILLAVGIAVGWYLGNSNSKKETAVTVSPTVITVYQDKPSQGGGTYEGEGFSFTYPKTMYIQKEVNYEVIWKADYTPDKYVYNSMILRKSEFPFEGVSKGGAFGVYARSSEDPTAIQVPIDELVETKETTIDGQPARIITFSCGVDCYYNVLRFDVSTTHYELVSDGAGGGLKQRFDDIVSSFKIEHKNVSADPCAEGNDSLCQVVTDVKDIIATKNVEKILSYQNEHEITCNDGSEFVLGPCVDVTGTQKRSGYSVSAYASEGIVDTKEQYLKLLSDEFSENSPYSYIGTVEGVDKAVIVAQSNNKEKLLIFPFKKINNEWRMEYMLTSNYPETEFLNLDEGVLSNVH